MNSFPEIVSAQDITGRSFKLDLELGFDSYEASVLFQDKNAGVDDAVYLADYIGLKTAPATLTILGNNRVLLELDRAQTISIHHKSTKVYSHDQVIRSVVVETTTETTSQLAGLPIGELRAPDSINSEWLEAFASHSHPSEFDRYLTEHWFMEIASWMDVRGLSVVLDYQTLHGEHGAKSTGLFYVIGDQLGMNLEPLENSLALNADLGEVETTYPKNSELIKSYKAQYNVLEKRQREIGRNGWDPGLYEEPLPPERMTESLEDPKVVSLLEARRCRTLFPKE